MPPYDDKILAFLDILGWSDLLEKSKKDDTLLRSVDSVAEQVAEISLFAPSIKEVTNNVWNDVQAKNPALPKWAECDMQSTHFSDTIVLTASPGELSTSPMIATVVGLAQVLLRAGYYVRGAITRGLIHHTDKCLYGPALVRAYALESKLAIYPRILIDENAVSSILVKNFVRVDPGDGMRFLNVLALSKPEHRAKFMEVLESLIRRDAGDLKKLQKHNWLKSYLGNFEANLVVK